MLGFVKNWLGPKPITIGIDFGSDSLKMAQVALVGGEWKLAAAACADVPAHVRHDATARAAFFVQTVRDLLAVGNFAGRNAILALPAASMFIQHLRLPKMDEEGLKKAIPWESRGKLPIDPMHALIRHVVAGEIYQDQEPRQEVIIMAAGRDLVNQFLAMASRAKVDVVGLDVEPKAIVDCFGHIYRRKTDIDITNCFVDLGCAGTRVVIARGPHILFARPIPIGGEHFTRAVAAGLGMPQEDARLLRYKLAGQNAPAAEPTEKPAAPPPERPAEGFAVLDAALAAANKTEDRRRPLGQPTPALAAGSDQSAAAEDACREPLDRLVEELDMCRRYYEATFPSRPVDRLVFLGGEARHRRVCQYIAQQLSLAAQVGDPMVRLARNSDIAPECGVDCRQPQPNWSVAIGLSMGAAAAALKEPAKVAAAG